MIVCVVCLFQTLIRLPSNISDNDYVKNFFEVTPEDINPPTWVDLIPTRKRIRISEKLSLSFSFSLFFFLTSVFLSFFLFCFFCCLFVLKNDSSKKEKKKSADTANEISDPVLLEQYTAIADYKKQKNTECDLTAGQVVEVIDKNENGKWQVPQKWV